MGPGRCLYHGRLREPLKNQGVSREGWGTQGASKAHEEEGALEGAAESQGGGWKLGGPTCPPEPLEVPVLDV
jgi:hypothetical protein